MSGVLRNLGRRSLTGLLLGTAFVVAAIVTLTALGISASLRATKTGETINESAPGVESRSVTMGLGLFVGAYISGFGLCSPKSRLGSTGPRVFVIGMMLITATGVFALGRSYLTARNLYWYDPVAIALSLTLGLVLGAGLYVVLGTRIPMVFPLNEAAVPEKAHPNETKN